MSEAATVQLPEVHTLLEIRVRKELFLSVTPRWPWLPWLTREPWRTLLALWALLALYPLRTGRPWLPLRSLLTLWASATSERHE